MAACKCEIEACNAIYPNSIGRFSELHQFEKDYYRSNTEYSLSQWPQEDEIIIIKLTQKTGFVLLRLSDKYPDSIPEYVASSFLSPDQINKVLYAQVNGLECLFAIYDDLRVKAEEKFSDISRHNTNHSVAVKGIEGQASFGYKEEPRVAVKNELEWFFSDPIKDRKSVFLAQATFVASEEEAMQALEIALQSKKISKVGCYLNRTIESNIPYEGYA